MKLMVRAGEFEANTTAAVLDDESASIAAGSDREQGDRYHFRRRLRLCALVPYLPDTTPSQRFRIEQWTPCLEENGISVDLKPFVSARLMKRLHQPGAIASKAALVGQAFLRRARDVFSAQSYDAIFIHRAACLAGPAIIERVIKLYRRPMIFDFDDAIYLLDTSSANRLFGWLKFPGKTASLCRLSSHVVAGSNHLADYARKYNPRVTVVPTSIDTDLYRPGERRGNGDRIVVGWTGSATSQTHLEMFADVLRELSSRRDVEIRVQSNRRPDLPGVNVVWTPWSPRTEVDELRHFDIGIKPMPDDEWTRGKCPMKEIQYMSLGIPTVCSAVGASREIIQHGKNGFLASNQQEWLNCLEKLIDDPALRQELGAASRRTVEDRYSTRRCADLFAGVIRETVDSFHSTPARRVV